MIKTARFNLRPLTLADVTTQYLSWFSDASVIEFISSAKTENDLDSLQDFVAKRERREDVLFLGIFTEDEAHIGNIKYEPIDTTLGLAVVGTLIGEVAWRGKGVAKEVISESALWLYKHRGISRVATGVSLNNHSAIIAYRKMGFVEEECELIAPDSNEARSMVLHISSVMK